MNWNAIGIVEVSLYSNTVVVLDSMLKAADVRLCSFHKKLGGKMVRGIVAGEVSAVDAAIDAAEASRSIIGKENLKVAVNISNPHPEVIKLMNMMNDLLDEEPVEEETEADTARGESPIRADIPESEFPEERKKTVLNKAGSSETDEAAASSAKPDAPAPAKAAPKPTRRRTTKKQ